MPLSAQALVGHARRFLFEPQCGPILAICVIFGDACLTQLIIRFIRYTEIDWETYMYHIELYLKGERDYSKISGPTGPLVYPAGHVYIHEALYKTTSSGLSIAGAQQIYGSLYIISLTLTCLVYLDSGSVPNWILLFLPLSKRLHSIYVLRLFNDCWEAAGAQAAILAVSWRYYSVAAIMLSLAISVKMSALLYMPGFLIIMCQSLGLVQTVSYGILILLMQAVLGYPFLSEHPWQYLSGAFDLSRVFLYKWTVNWRFLGEETFLSPTFAKALLFCHLCTLLAFAHFKWCAKEGGLYQLVLNSLKRPWTGSRQVTADHVITVLYTSNLIGIVFARSLHYQFYSWYAQQIPFLTWRTPYPLFVKILLLGAVEYAWNVFPSTNLSSAALLAANVCLLAGVWLSPENRIPSPSESKKTE